MSVRIAEINSAAAVVPVDLTRFGTCRVGPEFQPHLFYPPKGRIELVLRNEKRKMLYRDMLRGFKEVDRYIVRQIDNQKMIETPGFGKPEDVRQKSGRPLLVRTPGDRVV